MRRAGEGCHPPLNAGYLQPWSWGKRQVFSWVLVVGEAWYRKQNLSWEKEKSSAKTVIWGRGGEQRGDMPNQGGPWNWSLVCTSIQCWHDMWSSGVHGEQKTHAHTLTAILSLHTLLWADMPLYFSNLTQVHLKDFTKHHSRERERERECLGLAIEIFTYGLEMLS